MRGIKNKVLTLATIALTLTGIFPFGMLPEVSAGTEEETVTPEKLTVTDAVFATTDGFLLDANNPVEPESSIIVDLSWELAADTAVLPTEDTVLSLPDNLIFDDVAETQFADGTYRVERNNLIFNFNDNAYEDNTTTLPTEGYTQYSGMLSLTATVGKVTTETVSEDVDFGNNVVRTIHYDHGDDEGGDGDNLGSGQNTSGTGTVANGQVNGQKNSGKSSNGTNNTLTTGTGGISATNGNLNVPFARSGSRAYVGEDIAKKAGANKYMEKSALGQNTIFYEVKVLKNFGTDTNPNWQLVTGSTPLQIGDAIMFDYYWKIHDDFRKEIKTGDYFEFDLPDILYIDPKLPLDKRSGPLSDGENVFGSYVITPDKDGKGTVKITFDGEKVNAFNKVKGGFYVDGTLTRIKGNEGKPIEIPYFDSTEFDLPPIEVKNKLALAKHVDGNSNTSSDQPGSNVNQPEIEWRLKVNYTDNEMPAGSIVEDTFDKSLEYVSITKIEEYTIDPVTGTASDKKDVTSSTNIVPVVSKVGVGTDAQDRLTITFKEKTDKYYIIYVKTKVKDLAKLMESGVVNDKQLGVSIPNKVTLTYPNENPIEASATKIFRTKTTFSKSRVAIDEVNEIVTYKITVTHSGTKVPAGQIITDVMTGGQRITGTPVAKTSSNQTVSVTFTDNQNGNYDIKINDAITESFTIEYQVKYDKSASKWPGQSFTNTISIWGNSSSGSFTPDPWQESGIVKEFAPNGNPGPSYQSDTATWQIRFNTKNRELKKWNLKDTMSNGMYMTEEDKAYFKLEYSNDQGTTWTKVDDDRYKITFQLNPTSDHNFYIETIDNKMYTSPINDDAQFKVTYRVHYDNTDETGKDQKNTFNYNYWIGNFTYNHTGSEKINVPKPPEKDHLEASKGAAFDGVNDIITWTINLNNGQNKYTYVAGDLLTDPITKGYTYVPDSLIVTEVGQTTPAIGVKAELVEVKVGQDTSYQVEVSGFTPGTQKQYQIKFQTSIDKVPVSDGSEIMITPQGVAKNIAYFQEKDDKLIEIPASIEHRKSGGLVDKKAKISASDNRVYDFTVLVNQDIEGNKGDDKLELEDVVVIDDQSSTLKLVKDSMEVFHADGSKFVPDTDYKLVEGITGFILTFKVPIKEQVKLTYKSTIAPPVGSLPGDEVPVNNKVTISGTNFKPNNDDFNDKVKVSGNGGYASGIRGKIIITKTKATGGTLPDTWFELYRGTDDTDLVGKKETDSSGSITFDNLTSGNYFLKESNSSPGFFAETEWATGKVITLDIDEVNEIVIDQHISIVNKEAGDIQLIKEDEETSGKLSGAQFELYQWDDVKREVIKPKVTQNVNKGPIGSNGVFTTDTAGQFEIKNVLPGKYVFKEVSAPTNYAVNVDKDGYTAPFEVISRSDLGPNDPKVSIVTVTNQRIKADIMIYKHSDGQKLPLEGAEFKLTSTNRNETKSTLASGYVKFDNLLAGVTYQIEEVSNPFGYSGNFKITDIKVGQDGTVTYKQGKDTFTYDKALAIEAQNDRVYTKLSGKKIWKHDGMDADFVLPTEIKVTLMQKDHKGTVTPYGQPKTVTPGSNNNWEYTFDNLPKYDLTDPNGTFEYIYTVVEAGVGGFTTTVSDPKVTGNEITSDITNTVKPTEVKGEKSWDKAANGYDVIPEGNVEFTLFYKEKGAGDDTLTEFKRGNKVETTTTNEGKQWKYSYTNLPTHKNGKEIEYSVKETPVKGFTPAYTGYDTYNEMETTKVQVVKNWQDNENHYKSRPTTVNFTLLVKDGNGWKTFEEVYGTAKKLQLSGIHNVPMWTGEFANLPVYDKQGEEIVYGVREEQDGKIGVTYKVSDGLYDKAVDANNTATFNNDEQLVEIEVTKDWKDFDNKFSSRPTQIKFQVKSYPAGGNPATGEVVRTKANPTGVYTIVVKPDGTSDTLKVTGLPMYDNSATPTPLAYIIEEINMAANYEETPEYLQDENNKNDFTIVNKLIVVPNQVNKIWDEKGITTDSRPEVKFTLMHHIEGQTEEDAQPVGTEAEGYIINLKGNDLMLDNWTGHFANAPKFTNTGELYIYTVKEEMIGASKGNYTTTQAGSTFTNTLETTEVAGVKTWNDGGDQDGLRPTQIEVQLVKNKVPVPGVTKVVKPDADGNWNYNFTNLAKFDENGVANTYTIKELNLPTSYTVKVEGMDLENTHIPEIVNPNGQKFWDDQDDHFENRPEGIELYLIKADARPKASDYKSTDKWLAATEALKVAGTELTVKADEMTYVDANGNEQTVAMEAGAWKYNWDHLALPKYENGGKEINYLVIEKQIAIYGTRYMDEDADGDIADDFNFDITNRQAQLADTFQVDSEKTWEDDENQYDSRPEKVTFELYYKGDDSKPVDTKDVTANADGIWKHTFTLGLANYPKGTTADDFYVKEINLAANYIKEDGKDLNVKNSLKTIDVFGEKHWEDADNQDGKRPASIQVQLIQSVVKDGEVVEAATLGTPIDVEPNEDGKWLYEFNNLPAVDKDGEEYVYSVEEVNTPADYEAKAEGMDITNTHIPEKTQHSVKKVWVDADDNDGKRPDSIEVQLYADGVKLGKPVQLKDNQDELKAWQHTWTDLDKYADGKLIKYEVKEILGDEWKDFYTPKYLPEMDTTIITNVHTSITIDPKVTKLWKDDNQNISLTRPENIKVRLYADGELVKTVKFGGEGDTWTYQFNDLPKYKNGKEIKYEVEEEAVANYVTTIDGFTITNTYTPPTRPGLPSTGGGSSTSTTTRTSLPKTGSEQYLLWVPVIGLLFMLVAILGYGYKRKKSR